MTHEDYMRRALELARQAMAHGDVPVGCVIVDESGAILGVGHLRRLRRPGQLAAVRLHPVRHPGALPHVRRGHHQRPDRGAALWGQGGEVGLLRFRAQSV